LEGRLGEAFCAAAIDTGSTVPLAHGAASLSLEDCLAVTSAFFKGWYGTSSEAANAAIADGKLLLDTERADECVLGLCALGASSAEIGRLEWPDACWRVFVGLQDDGQACDTDYDCSGTARCDRASLGCAGTCADPGQLVTRDCDPACEPGQSCVYTANGPYCRAEGAEGTFCQNADECQPGLACDYTAQACVVQQVSVSLGAACRPEVDTCEAPYLCVAADDSDGSACGAAKAVGTACRAFSLDCGTAGWCDFEVGQARGTCQAKRADGEACTRNQECALLCHQGTCRSSLVEDGQPCTFAEECAGGVCGGSCASVCP
jgi:hypothetical protein